MKPPCSRRLVALFAVGICHGTHVVAAADDRVPARCPIAGDAAHGDYPPVDPVARRLHGFVNAGARSAILVFDLQTLQPNVKWPVAPGSVEAIVVGLK